MKLLLLLSFFSFALCALQEAFYEYSQLQSISEEEFAGIQKFISRVEEAKSEELVTEEDKEKLQELQFQSLVFSVFFPESLQNDPKEDSQVTWGDIDASCRRVETKCDENNVCKTVEHGMPFAKVLRLLYCVESVDSLSREEFFDFFYLLDFLQGGRQRDPIVKMEALNNTLQSFISNSDLRYFANENQEVNDVLLAILSPGTLSVDFQKLEFRFGQEIEPVVERVLKRLATQSKLGFFSNLKKVEIHLITTTRMETFLFEILEKNADTLTSLSIKNLHFVSPRMILFPNITELSIMLGYMNDFKLHFLFHSNYTTLCINRIISISNFSGKEYFQLCEGSHNFDSLMKLIKENKNLELLVLSLDQGVYEDSECSHSDLEKFKSALGSLKNLKIFGIIICPFDLEGCFNPENEIHSFTIIDDEKLNWQSLGKELPHLRHLFTQQLSLKSQEGFLKFISSSKLESISVFRDYELDGENIQLISALNQLPTLKKIGLQFKNNTDMEFLRLDERFEALSINLVCPSESESLPSNLPIGPGIKYLRIRTPSNDGLQILFNSLNVQIMKGRFPNLRLLILPKGSRIEVSPDEVDCEVRIGASESEDDLFESVPSLTLNIV